MSGLNHRAVACVCVCVECLCVLVCVWGGGVACVFLTDRHNTVECSASTGEKRSYGFPTRSNANRPVQSEVG